MFLMVKVLIIGVAPICVVPKSVPFVVIADELYDTTLLFVPVTLIKLPIGVPDRLTLSIK